MEAIFWLAVVIVLVIVEIATLGLTTIWFAGGALVSCIASLLGANYLVQVILFLVVSIVLLLFTRPVAIRYMNKNRTKTNVDSLIGEEAVVLEAIDNLKAEGQVQLNGVAWAARTQNNEQRIEKGAIVEVIRVEGVKAIVQKKADIQ
ncbi:MAG: NfeD family protein [Clostridia bacterium]|nr:NfeD family protein [Clostridia bacterium]NCC42970.1 NfeD family protein [Clostridia bacterium]